jgi:hypothetical protein
VLRVCRRSRVPEPRDTACGRPSAALVANRDGRRREALTGLGRVDRPGVAHGYFVSSAWACTWQSLDPERCTLAASIVMMPSAPWAWMCHESPVVEAGNCT